MKSVGSSKLHFWSGENPLWGLSSKTLRRQETSQKRIQCFVSGCDSIGVWMVTSCSPEELRRWPPISCFHFETPSVHGCDEKTQELLAAFFHAEFLLLKKYDHDISWVIQAWSLRLNYMRQKYALRKWMASITGGFKSYRARQALKWLMSTLQVALINPGKHCPTILLKYTGSISLRSCFLGEMLRDQNPFWTHRLFQLPGIPLAEPSGSEIQVFLWKEDQKGFTHISNSMMLQKLAWLPIYEGSYI